MPISPQYCVDVALARLIEAKAALLEGRNIARQLPADDDVNNGISLLAETSSACAAVQNAVLAVNACVRRLANRERLPHSSPQEDHG